MSRFLERVKNAVSLGRHGPIANGLRFLRVRYFYPRFGKITAWRRRQMSTVFIGITGSSAKSTTAALLTHILAQSSTVHDQIIRNSIIDTLKNIWRIPKECDYAIMEVGTGSVGQIKLQADVIQPDLAIVTLVALEHRTQLPSLEIVAEEKGDLVRAVRAGGMALLNGDNEYVSAMAENTDERIVTFGCSDGVDYQAVNIRSGFPKHLTLDVRWRGGMTTLETRFVADQFWLSSLAAFAAAMELKVPPQVAAGRIASYEPIVNRFGVLEIDGGPVFIVDSAKAPLHSLEIAFDAVAKATAPRKRIVLGNISDYAGNPRPKYRGAYQYARKCCDEVIFVGRHAHRSRASQEDKDAGRFREFATTEQVSDYIKSTAVAGELILLKSSSNIHLERVALAWTNDVKCWEDQCGLGMSCYSCRLYEVPFGNHKRLKRKRSYKKLRSRNAPWRENP